MWDTIYSKYPDWKRVKKKKSSGIDFFAVNDSFSAPTCTAPPVISPAEVLAAEGSLWKASYRTALARARTPGQDPAACRR